MVHVSRFESQKAFQYLKWAIRSTILEVNFWKTINTCIRKMSCTCHISKEWVVKWEGINTLKSINFSIT